MISLKWRHCNFLQSLILNALTDIYMEQQVIYWRFDVPKIARQANAAIAAFYADDPILGLYHLYAAKFYECELAGEGYQSRFEALIPKAMVIIASASVPDNAPVRDPFFIRPLITA